MSRVGGAGELCRGHGWTVQGHGWIVQGHVWAAPRGGGAQGVRPCRGVGGGHARARVEAAQGGCERRPRKGMGGGHARRARGADGNRVGGERRPRMGAGGIRAGVAWRERAVR